VLWWIFRQSTSPCKSAKKGWFVLFLSTAVFFFPKLITEKQKLASHCTQVDTLGECNNTNNANDGTRFLVLLVPVELLYLLVACSAWKDMLEDV
jgi:hypothetical protein